MSARKRSARSLAAIKGWETRRAKAKARSDAARKGWETRRARAEPQRKPRARPEPITPTGWRAHPIGWPTQPRTPLPQHPFAGERERVLGIARLQKSGARPVIDVRWEGEQLLATDAYGRPVRGYAIVNTRDDSIRIYWTDAYAFEVPDAAISSEYESLRPHRYRVVGEWEAA